MPLVVRPTRAKLGPSTAILAVISAMLLSLLSPGVAPTIGADSTRTLRMVSSGFYAGSQFDGAYADGGRILFDTSAKLSPDDTDGGIDVYASIGGKVELMSPEDPNYGNHQQFVGASPNGRTAFFTTIDPILPVDTDPGMDIYGWTEGAAAPVLITPGLGFGAFRAASTDGSRVLFESHASFNAADTDTALDLYLWDHGTVRLVSGATPDGAAGAIDAQYAAVADDLNIVLFMAAAPLVAGAPTGGATYQWQSDEGLRVRVPDPNISVGKLTADGSALGFETVAGLVPGDTDGEGDAYLEDGSFHLLTDGTVAGDSRVDDVISGYDTWVTLTTADALVASDTDGKFDAYRWTESTDSSVLLTPGNGPFDARLLGGTATGPIAVLTTEALVAADTDASPDLYLIDPAMPEILLASSGTVNDQPEFLSLSVLGDRLLFSSTMPLVAGDADGVKTDIYEFDRSSGDLVSIAGPDSDKDATFKAASTDGALVIFQTASSLVPEDTNIGSWDVYSSSTDTTPPETGAPQILPGTTPLDTLDFKFSSTDGVRFECRVDGGDWVDCASPWHLTELADGDHIADVRAYDRVGNFDPSPASQGWRVDRTGPTGTVTIDGGALKTGRALVRVALPATDLDNVIGVRLSASPSLTDQGCGLPACQVLEHALVAQYPDGAPHEITFDMARPEWGGSGADGVHTVYVQWQDAVSNWSAVESDAIVVDHSSLVGTTVTVRALTNPAAVAGSSFLEATVIAADGVVVNVGTVRFTGGGVNTIDYPVSVGVVNHWQTGWTAGTHVITATYSGASDLAGSSGTVTQQVGPDTAAPTVTAPSQRLAAATATSPTMPVRLTWSGTDPSPASGIAHYELRQSTDGAPSVLVSTTLASPATTRSLHTGHVYRFAVRAIDRAGHASAWIWGPTFHLTRASEASASITYRGRWHTRLSASYFGGAVKAATGAGATATFHFTGRQVAWMTTLGPTRGRARIYVDGTYVRTIDLGAATTQPKRLVYSFVWSRARTHTITIRVVGGASRARVDIDGFAVIR